MRLPLMWSCVLLCVGWLLGVLSLYVCGSNCVLWSLQTLLNVAVLFVCACCRGSFIELCWAWNCLRSCSRVLLLFCFSCLGRLVCLLERCRYLCRSLIRPRECVRAGVCFGIFVCRFCCGIKLVSRLSSIGSVMCVGGWCSFSLVWSLWCVLFVFVCWLRWLLESW